MGFYNKYEKALEKHGYTVDDRGCVTDAMGNQAAAEDAYGNVQCKDPNVTAICTAAQAEMDKPKPKPKPKPKKVETLEDGD